MKITKLINLVLLLMLLLSSCASAQGDSSPSITPALSSTPFPFMKEVPTPSPTPEAELGLQEGVVSAPTASAPTSSPVFVDGYQIHLEENTFLLQKPIRPDPQRNTELVLAIDGSLDEHQYILLAQRLRILDAKTGEERQSFPLSHYNGPFWLTTLSSSMELSSELVIEDLNFDGYNDFRILVDVGTAGTDVYQYWTWNERVGQFDKSAELEELKLYNPKFDFENQTIVSHYADSATDSEERMYRYIDGKPKLVKWVKCSFDSYIEKLHVITAEVQDGALFVTEEYVND